MAQSSVLIVDDHEVVLGGIRSVLGELPDFHIIGEAGNGRDAVRLVKELKPEIVIMDIAMPDLNGLDATLQIRKFDQSVKIIILSMHSHKEYVLDLIKAGVSAFILKEDPVADFLLAVRAVRGGATYFSTMVQKVLLDHIRELEDGVGTIPDDSFRELSLREREVLQLLAEGNTIKDIAFKLGLSTKTVETHKYNILQKLNVRTTADLTRIAIKRKLISL